VKKPKKVDKMKESIRGLSMSVITVIVLFVGMTMADAVETPFRRTLNLDGQWQIAEGGMDQAPEKFDRSVPVPGLVDLATPAFNDVGIKTGQRSAFWYRRTFKLDTIPPVARLKVHKAMFGAQVILNGQVIGEHRPSFTPGYFDVKAALKTGENELLIRVGADRDAVGPSVPSGYDVEKTLYVPGIFDSVDLICSGTPHIMNAQAVPDIENNLVRVQVNLRNDGEAVKGVLKVVVREVKSGKVAGRLISEATDLAKGTEATVDVRIPLVNCRLWSPEDPFLYTLEVSTVADNFTTRFGMRSFRFDPQTRRALLNGKPYFMRGSNLTLYRFFEDSSRKALPWNKDWVRTLHQRAKDMHWNCLRYSIGFPPEFWYDIADEEGILIQDEYPLWYFETPKELKQEQFALEYAEWVRERWNHACVVIWDASNETNSSQTAPAISKVRGLDLSNRPWDNSYMPPLEPGDAYEVHPYHFNNDKFKLSDLSKAERVPRAFNVNDGQHAAIINEYGYLWLNRDGTPTTLTGQLYKNLLGNESTTEQRRHLYARYMAAETEFWRCYRQAAAVMHFSSLSYARPNGQTSDHWLDVENLTWEPEFYKYVRDAFSPVGLMIESWDAEYPAGKVTNIPVIVINDLNEKWSGVVRFRLLRDGKPLQEKSETAEIVAYGDVKLTFNVTIPAQSGVYQLEAALIKGKAAPVVSLRDFVVITENEKAARLGLAAGKPVKASSSLETDGASVPGSIVDGRADTRWSSDHSDDQWIAVDLGKKQMVSRVELDWENAFGRELAIEVSEDGQAWKEAKRVNDSRGGRQVITFDPVEGRWIRIHGIKRGTVWGYSIWEMRVFAK
jgi:hypothetical protein